ncbi:ATP-binding protein [Luteimonas sp. TWI662]|uniref:sensor histidine kinase n=1 Tax=Luteimonas sp. TWI662 TaxID=3136789 RepID=UPI00320B675D
MPAESRDDALGGLRLIEQRSLALQRFLGGYARLARLPPPVLAPVALDEHLQRIHRLIGDGRVCLHAVPPLRVIADADQLEQVLINLLRNALEADMAGGEVEIACELDGDHARISIADLGPGLPPSDNLFVPFFTTKPGGSGIGLVLSRQIIEAQTGSLQLLARDDAPGSVACVRLPLAGAHVAGEPHVEA